VAGAIAVAGILVYRSAAPFIFRGLVHEGLPLVILSALCGLAVLAMLHRGIRRGVRPVAIGAVIAVIWAWGVAQYPYLLPRELTITSGASASETLTLVLGVFGVAVVVVLPSLGLLYTLAQRSMLEGEGEAPQPVPPPAS
jgi:cytochrome d ubiquinol oxidase subunit II